MCPFLTHERVRHVLALDQSITCSWAVQQVQIMEEYKKLHPGEKPGRPGKWILTLRCQTQKYNLGIWQPDGTEGMRWYLGGLQWRGESRMEKNSLRRRSSCHRSLQDIQGLSLFKRELSQGFPWPERYWVTDQPKTYFLVFTGFAYTFLTLWKHHWAWVRWGWVL